MLKVSKSSVDVSGVKIDLMAEFTLLTHSLIENGAFTEEDLDMCINTAKKSSEDVAREAKEAAEKLQKLQNAVDDEDGSSLLDLLMSLFGE